MSKKLPFMQWVAADWIMDTRHLTPQAKAAWIDLLCFMWNAPERGKWTGTIEQLARVIRADLQTAKDVLPELATVANLTLPNKNLTGNLTLENRRMVKRELRYTSNAKRQKRWYWKHKPNAQPNGNLTRQTLGVRSSYRASNTLTAGKEAKSPEPFPGSGISLKPGLEIKEPLPVAPGSSKSPGFIFPVPKDADIMTPEDWAAMRAAIRKQPADVLE